MAAAAPPPNPPPSAPPAGHTAMAAALHGRRLRLPGGGLLLLTAALYSAARIGQFADSSDWIFLAKVLTSGALPPAVAGILLLAARGRGAVLALLVAFIPGLIALNDLVRIWPLANPWDVEGTIRNFGAGLICDVLIIWSVLKATVAALRHWWFR